MVTLLGNFCFSRRWWVLGAWVLVAAVGAVAIGPLFSQLSLNKPAQGMESNVARQVLTAEGDKYDRIIAVVDHVDPAAPATAEAIDSARADLLGLDGIKTVADPQVAADGTAVALTVTLGKLEGGERRAVIASATERLDRVADEVEGASVVIGGDEPQATETNRTSAADTTRAELLGLPLTLLVLVVVFGGLLAALLPVLAAVAAITGSFAVLLVFSAFFSLDSTLISVVALLGLGLSIDYGLLLVARYREELTAGHTPADAVTRTWASAGRTIVFSGLIVIAALSGLLTFSVPRLQTLGAAGISATLVAMLASLTLTASLLGLWGARIAPSERAAERARHGDAAIEQGLFARLAGATQRRPVAALVLSGVVLLTLAIPAVTTNARLPQVEALPRDVMESARAADLLRDKFDVVAQPAVEVLARSSPAELDGWASAWRSDPAVTGIERAVATGDNLSRVVINAAGDSQGPEALGLVSRLRQDRPAVESWVLGDAAVLLDLNDKVAEGLPLALSVVLIAMIVLLFLMTGSLLVPLKVICTNVLSLGATVGVMVALFQYGWLSGPLGTTVTGGLGPYTLLTVLAFAFGFSMDYEVFLLGRVKEYVDSGQDTDTAVRHGLQRSGGIITSAALLMMIVFAAFGLGDLADIEQLGVGLFVAVLIDATLVRCVLVPATMALLGPWNWWAPRALRPLHDRFGLQEGARQPAPRRVLSAR